MVAFREVGKERHASVSARPIIQWAGTTKVVWRGSTSPLKAPHAQESMKGFTNVGEDHGILCPPSPAIPTSCCLLPAACCVHPSVDTWHPGIPSSPACVPLVSRDADGACVAEDSP